MFSSLYLTLCKTGHAALVLMLSSLCKTLLMQNWSHNTIVDAVIYAKCHLSFQEVRKFSNRFNVNILFSINFI